MRTQSHDGESLDSPVSGIVLSDSDSDADTEVQAITTRVACTPDYVGSDTSNSKAGPVNDTNLFDKIFDEIYEQYQKGYTTWEIDQLSAKLASVIPEKESAETPATTAEPTADLTAEHSITLSLDTDLAKLQGDAVAIALIWSKLNCSFSSERKKDIH